MICVEDVQAKFPVSLSELLMFHDEGDFVVVNRKAFLDQPDFAEVCRIVTDLKGEYVKLSKPNNGTLSHWKIPKIQASPSEERLKRMDEAIKNVVKAWKELNPH